MKNNCRKNFEFNKFLGKNSKKLVNALCCAVLIGAASTPTGAEGFDVSAKPIDMPTLDYLKNNNKDLTTEIIPSIYTITAGTKDNYSFVYKTADEKGNVTTDYYKINLKEIPTSSESIKWEQVLSAGENTIEVNLPNNGVQYFKYTYTKPENYEIVTETISNDEIIGNISGAFINNDDGWAIYNEGTINKIVGDFINNNSTTIYNKGTINKIVGDFINNNSTTIYNKGTINEIAGTFINNNWIAIDNYGLGVAEPFIDKITGDFINNEIAIYNIEGEIGEISGNFINNRTAISNQHGKINEISGNFINNSDKVGGAIKILGFSETGNINGNFINNRADERGGALAIGSIVKNIKGNFIRNSVEYDGDEIYTNMSHYALDEEPQFFSDNSVMGGAILFTTYAEAYGNSTAIFPEAIIGNFIENTVTGKIEARGGAISAFDAKGILTIEDSNFINNAAISKESGAYGGAISNVSDADGYSYILLSHSFNYKDLKDQFNPNSMVIKNTNFEGNYAEGKTDARGGAIFTIGDCTILADNGISSFNNNYVIVDGKKDNQAIFMDSLKNLNLIAQNNGTVIMNDKISGLYVADLYKGEDGYNLNIDGDATGKVFINNKVSAVDKDGNIGPMEISLSNTNLYLGKEDVFNGNNLVLNSGLMSMINGQVGVSALNSMTVAGNTNFVADVDLQNQTMDRFTAKSYGQHTGYLNVAGVNLLNDAPIDRNTTAIYFAEPGLKNYIAHTIGEVPTGEWQDFTAYTPIYKYNVSYDKDNEYNNQGDGGYFVFTRGGSNGDTPSNPSEVFNPAVLSTPVASNAASRATLNETFKYVFEHADAFTQLPSIERMAYINANKYALSPDFNENPTYSLDTRYDYTHGSLALEHNKAAWVRPYTTIESIDLKNGPKVDALTYGTLIGYDGEFKEMRHHWYRVGTGYLGYHGSQLKYAGNNSSTNGGLIGLTETYYRNNFWTAITASVGASIGETSTMYGHEDFTNLLAGVASKTGYNFEFKDSKYILQPIWLMSYTFVKTLDYTNSAGVSIDSSPAHALQFHPSLRFITNCKNGWQPYIQAGVVWDVMNSSNITANGIRLPKMGIKPYAEYGLGIQRNWKDNYTAFFQAMFRSGGRDGVAFTLGFRWNIGKDRDEHHKHDNL